VRRVSLEIEREVGRVIMRFDAWEAAAADLTPRIYVDEPGTKVAVPKEDGD
jgi:hypothetical protein